MIYDVLKKKNGFDIVEKNTETTLQLSYNNAKAKSICESLNSGSGFDGWTPSFFSENFKNK